MSWQTRSFILVLVGMVVVGACGGGQKPPPRGVIERDIDSWKFRRYQQFLDLEVWIEDNPAVMHSASYVPRAAWKRGKVSDRDVVNAVITRYEHDRAIVAELVKFVRRLAKERGYIVEEVRLRGVRLFSVVGHGEAWVLWPAAGHVVKIGGRAIDKVPEALISSYGKPYPSRLTPGALEGPVPGKQPSVSPAKKKAQEVDK
jgi:hypothetical protein